MDVELKLIFCEFHVANTGYGAIDNFNVYIIKLYNFMNLLCGTIFYMPKKNQFPVLCVFIL